MAYLPEEGRLELGKGDKEMKIRKSVFAAAGLSVFIYLVCMSAMAGNWGDPIWLAGDGTVYHVDSFNRICRNGVRLSWTIDSNRRELWLVDDGVYYFDSRGNFMMNGISTGYRVAGQPVFDEQGRCYYLDSRDSSVKRDGMTLFRNADIRSPLYVSPEGVVFWTSAATRTLWMNNRDMGMAFRYTSALVSPDNVIYYRRIIMEGDTPTYELWRLDTSDGERKRLGNLRGNLFGMTDDEEIMWISRYGTLRFENEAPAYYNIPYSRARLYGAGEVVYTGTNGNLFKNGRDTGWKAPGWFDVDSSGDVTAIVNISWGRLERNGQSMPFRLY